MNDPVFEILVYACTQDAFVERVVAKSKAEMADIPDDGSGYWQEAVDDTIKRRLKPVRYNELVGCIEVFTFDAQLRARYWFIDKTRIIIGSGVKGVIKPRGELVENHYNRSPLTGSLAVAAMTATALSLFHDLDATIMILVWNLGIAALIVGVGSVLGNRARALEYR